MSTDKNLFDLQLDLHARDHLKASAKWARFLAIVGFIFIGLLILVLIVVAIRDRRLMEEAGVEADDGEMIGAIAGSLIVFVFYFFPCLFMLRFGNKMLVALAADDIASLNDAFRNLKITFRYFGVVTIISLVLLFLGLLVELAGN